MDTFAQCSEEFLEKSFKKFPDTSLEKVLWKLLKEILQGDSHKFLEKCQQELLKIPQEKKSVMPSGKVLNESLKGF